MQPVQAPHILRQRWLHVSTCGEVPVAHTYPEARMATRQHDATASHPQIVDARSVGENIGQRTHSAGIVLHRSSEISLSTLPSTAALILRPASSQYSSSISAPTKKRPSSLAATPVVPDPQNGSKTRSPSRVEATSARRTSLRGFWVGW